MWPSHTVAFAIAAVSVDSLDGPESLTLVSRGGSSCSSSILDLVCFRAGEIFRDFDLDVAEVPFTSTASTTLLGRVFRLRGAWWTALHATVPVVGDEGLSFIALRRAMRIHIVHVWEIRLKPGIVST